ncbi:MAG: hypothetical protein KGK01_07775 [Bradyrhizobium sp.]|uniref:hypothetical protein n=1 Tax=Bradyrhizobium sp. TaxID=376 RepID=UPI0023A1F428|nr:hypothetical protein [Bradyrhizobium sp.]MDE2242328.1 hypothetical protein [Bradyrhizobium sp.]MDE2472579.1 hypothetical protein [Bradyrhizobium sp.]
MTFGGVVIFEVLFLGSLQKRLSKEAVVLLYTTRILMLRVHFSHISTMPESSFGRLLMVKVALAAIVLIFSFAPRFCILLNI